MSPFIIQVGLLLLLLLCDLCTSSLLKLYYQSGLKDHWKIALCIAIYCIVPVLILYSLQYDGIGNTNLYWNVLSTVFVYMLAVFYFGEKISNVQCVGVFLAITGVLLIIYNK